MSSHYSDATLFQLCNQLIKKSDRNIKIINFDLGQRIRYERIRLNLSVADAARIAGVSTSTWRNYEFGISHPKGKSLFSLLNSGFSLVGFSQNNSNVKTFVDISGVIRSERLRLDLTINAAARLLCITNKALEQYEMGIVSPPVRTLTKMQIMGMRFDGLLCENNVKKPAASIHPTESLLLKTFCLLDQCGRMLFCEIADQSSRALQTNLEHTDAHACLLENSNSTT